MKWFFLFVSLTVINFGYDFIASTVTPQTIAWECGSITALLSAWIVIEKF